MTRAWGDSSSAPRPSLSWRQPGEAAWLICTGRTVRTSAPVAFLVGSVLSLVNQGAVLLSGTADVATAMRVAANYAIPYAVSGWGYLVPFRQVSVGHRDPSPESVRPSWKAGESDDLCRPRTPPLVGPGHP